MKTTWLWMGAAVLALAFLYLPALGVGAGQIAWVLLLLLCPLIHFLGGHGHGTHRGGGASETGPSAPGSREMRASNREEA
jgi:hypothetical protein